MKPLLAVLSLVPLALAVGFLSTQLTTSVLLWGSVAIAIFLISFIRIEFGLYILIFSMLLSPEIIVGQTQGASLGRGVTLRFEDFLLVLIGLSWFARTAVIKELGLFRKTPLNRPIAYYIMHRWLQSFAYRSGIGWLVFILSGFIALAIALLTVSYQAVKAAIANPVESLRYE